MPEVHISLRNVLSLKYTFHYELYRTDNVCMSKTSRKRSMTMSIMNSKIMVYETLRLGFMFDILLHALLCL